MSKDPSSSDAIPTCHVHYGQSGLRNFTGGATSAGKMKKKVGVINTSKVRVENGRMISWAELCRSFNEAAEQLLNRRQRRSKNNTLTIYQTQQPTP